MSEQACLTLLQDILDNGVKKSIYGHEDKYLLSLFGRMIRFDMSEGFPIMTNKFTYWKGAFIEMLWFKNATRDIVQLHKQKVYIWDDWGCKHYNKVYKTNLTTKEFQDLIDEGELTEWKIPLHYSNSTAWEYTKFDYYNPTTAYLNQTHWVIDNIKKTPDRKSFLVSYWNPTEVYQMADECGKESVTLPACHTHYNINVSKGKLSLLLSMRSWDFYLGGPFNIAQYAMLLHMYAHCTGFEPGELIISVADIHLYSNQLEQAKELLTRKPYTLPTLKIKDRGQQYLEDFVFEDFEVVNYKHHPKLAAEVVVVGGY
jgi:thymidylate synthase